MRRRYRQDSRTGKLVEITKRREAIHGIIPDIEPFQSHVDGTWIDSRKSLEAHNRRNGVRSVDEFRDEIERRTRRREAVHGVGNFDTEERIEALKVAYDLHSSNRSESDRRQVIENFIRHQERENQHG